MKIKRSDNVIILGGKDRGKVGKIVSTSPQHDLVVVDKLNLVKKNLKPSSKNRTGGIISKPAPLHVSSVALICPKCNKKTRIAFKIEKDKNKKRVCVKCREEV